MADQEASVQQRAAKVLSSLDSQIPVLVRYMRPSHVSGGFWMGLSKQFCESFMSKEDISMTLVDEHGNQFEDINYLADRTALSGGWKGFAKAHGLKQGDAVLFQLIDTERFKIYIVRKDGALGLLQLNAQPRRGNAGKNKKRKTRSTVRKPRAKRQRRAVAKGNAGEKMKFAAKWCLPLNVFDESLVVTELPDHVKDRYYKLCCSRKSLLHINLVRSGNHKSVTGIITEAVEIADAILSFKLSNTTKDELTSWKTKLQEFQKLGMDVAFMIPRIDEFMKLFSI